MTIKMEFTFDADWYCPISDDRFDWLVEGTYTPEQLEKRFCAPENCTPYEYSEFEITSVKFDGMEGGPSQDEIDALEHKIIEQADSEAETWGDE